MLVVTGIALGYNGITRNSTTSKEGRTTLALTLLIS